MYLCGVDIGGTKITVSIADKKKIKTKIYQKTKLEGDNKTIPRQVNKLITNAAEKAGIKKKSIKRIGVSSAGPFLKNEIVAPNLCGGIADREKIPNDWTNIPLKKELEKIYDEIIIENDAVSAVIAEKIFGAGREENNVLYVTWSTGIGTGAYTTGIDAETGEKRVFLLKGKNGNAPHGGHIYISEDGPQCGCGNYGDLESMTSGANISINPKKLFSLYEKDKDAKRIITNAAKNFARGLASLNAVLDTKIIIIGGSVFMNNINLLMPLIEEEFYKSFHTLSKDVIITPSELDDYLGDIAALSLVMPSEWIKEWRNTKPWKNAPEQVII